MGSQYLLANNNSPEIITVPFEHYSAIQIRIGNTKEISHSPFPSRHLHVQSFKVNNRNTRTKSSLLVFLLLTLSR